MRMKRSYLLLIPALFVSILFACKKEPDGPQNTVTPGSFRSLEEAITSTAPLARKTSMSVPSGGTIIAPGGTTFIFPPNAFETLTGGKVTGSVDVTVQDWLKKGDMVFGRVLPITFGKTDPPLANETFEKVLRSGGEGFVQVTQDGRILRVKKGIKVLVLFPQFGAPEEQMWGWTGRTMTGSANTVNWVLDSADLKPVNYFDTIAVPVDTLHYIQAALPIAFDAYNNFTVKLTSPVVLEKSMAVALYDGVKAIFPLPAAVNGQVNVAGLPNMIGGSATPIHIAVMGINRGNFYGGVLEVLSPSADSVYSVTIKAMEPPTLKLQLNSL